MTAAEGQREGERRRGALDPVLSNRDGLLSAMEERNAPADRALREGGAWAHRRGEPRLLVLLWSIYLLGASAATILRLPAIGMTEPRFVHGAARMLLALIAVGLLVLWPMVRLSQASPRRPMLATSMDLLALLATLMAVIWPITWLGGWRWDVTLGETVLLGGWGALVGGLVAAGIARSTGPWRTLWMVLVLACAVAGPVGLAVYAWAGGVPPAWAPFTSPLTAAYALAEDPLGRTPTMSAGEWLLAGAPLLAAIPLWAAVGAALAGRSRLDSHDPSA